MNNSDKQRAEEIAVLWTNAQPVVVAYVSSIVRKFQDTDDILQQVAVAVIKNYEKYDKKCSFVAWAIGIAKNEILMYRRNNSKGMLILDAKAIERVSEVYEKESAKFDDTREALDICIKKLRGRWKQILEMRYLSELNITRIAQKLGMTHSAVYTNLHRIRLALRECVDRQISSGELR
jgi:RNA polymerase sigma-70 factor (ECF subfamily)